MGGVTSILSGGLVQPDKKSAAAEPAPAAAPVVVQPPPVEGVVGDPAVEEEKRKRAGQGRARDILTTPLGLTGGDSSARKTLLGS